MGKLRIMVVGAGSAGRRHRENLERLGTAPTLVPHRTLKDRPLAKLLDKKTFDGAVIATATDVRLPLIEEFAQRNIPMYVEKPLAFRAGDLKAIKAATSRVCYRSMVGFMMRYHPGFLRLADEDLSSAWAFEFTNGHDVNLWREGWSFEKSYAARAEGGGALLDLCHEIDMASYLFPGLEAVRTRSEGREGFPGVDFASDVYLCSKGALGPPGRVSVDYLRPSHARTARIEFLGRTAELDFVAGTLSDCGRTRDVSCERNALFMSAMEDFLKLMQGRYPASHIDLVPRLDLVSESSELIAKAWESRELTVTDTTREAVQ